jgi:hypothetical protein
MQPLRNLPVLVTARATTARRALRAGVALAAVGLAACSDAPTGALPGGDRAPRFATVSAGDTTYTTFRIDPKDNGTVVIVGGVHKLDVPPGAICDPATSGYGPTLWDAPCTPATAGITFTAKSWSDAAGHPRLEISPDVRFVPGKVVTMFMKDKNAALDATSNIWYCATGATGCVDETKADPTLAPSRDGNGGYVSRRVKHFSGYTVIVGLDFDGERFLFDRSASAARAAGYITTTGIDAGGPLPEGLDHQR